MLGIDRTGARRRSSITSMLGRADAISAENSISRLQRTQQTLRGIVGVSLRRRDGREIIMEISSTPIEFEGAPANMPSRATSRAQGDARKDGAGRSLA